eukprot:CAMPEP_0181121664 /NCGR_PEP_ID=MMETSP1071-20121207/24867_1 /TAXON_ID=35127 /ORGANISM="Thalassiosira sp., Strain NH16" /LENGTH=955 /DNA_ID=CAMNT_0023206515 /DNA_START=190 /DNA_END=3057 /DNA_ORIENTATION=-
MSSNISQGRSEVSQRGLAQRIQSTSKNAIDWLSKDHIEVTIRITMSCLVGYVLTIAYLPAIIPPSVASLLALLVPFLGFLMPTLCFSWAGVIVPFFTLFVMSWGISAGLLASCVVGGNDLLVAMFALVSLWLGSLRFNKATGAAASLAAIVIVYNVVLLFPNYRTVQDGFSMEVAVDTVIPPSAATKEALRDFYGPAIRSLVEKWKSDNENGGSGGFVIENFSHDCISGIDIQINLNESDDGSITAVFPGGMWQIHSMWTCSGTTNPLAVYHNMTLMLMWIYAILAIISLTPPWRTIRSALTRDMIPGTLNTAAKHIRLCYQMLDIESENGDIERTQKENVQKIQGLTRGGLVKYSNALFGGKLAYYTAFEPRLLRCGPPECTYELLVELSNAVSKCGIIALGLEELVDSKENVLYQKKVHLQAAETMEKCALALATGELPDCDEVTNEEVAAPKNTLSQDDDITSSMMHKSVRPDAMRLNFHADNVLTATRSWLKAMGPPERAVNCCFTKDGFTSVMGIIKPFVLAHFIFLRRLLHVAFVTPFQASSWKGLFEPPYINFIKVGWCIKFSVGMTALVAMTVMWPEFRSQFVVRVDESASAIASSNSGWAIVAYCFSTTQTSEGTVTKGLLRLLGTCLGGFSGWLAVLACQDSSHRGEINPYGLIAWLTITTSVCVFVATERGFMARIALSADYMNGSVYFVVTEVIVVYYCFYLTGPESINAVAVNRIVANVVGIAFAMVLGFIPPCLWGGDPRFCDAIADQHQQNLAAYLSIFLNGMRGNLEEGKAAAEMLDSLLKSHMSKDVTDHDLVSDFYSDAARLQKLKIFMVDPLLKLELALTARDISVVSYIPNIMGRLLVNPEYREEFKKKQDTLVPFLKYFLQTNKGETVEKPHLSEKAPEMTAQSSRYMGIESDSVNEGGILLELLLQILEMLEGRLNGRREVLGKVQRGYIGGC